MTTKKKEDLTPQTPIEDFFPGDGKDGAHINNHQTSLEEINVDLIERNGEVYIIELTGRVGANCLPELTGNYFGINYYEMILATCLGESPLPYWEQRKDPSATMARMIKSENNGVVKSISLPETGNDAEIHLFVHEGSEVRAFTNSNDAIGEVIVKGATLKDCELKIGSILKSIEIRFK